MRRLVYPALLTFALAACGDVTPGDGPDGGEGEPPVDTQAPDTTITAGPAASTNQAEATFEFAADEEDCTFQCQVNTNPWTDCVSPYTIGLDEDGTYLVNVAATDPAGNTDITPASHSWSLDRVAPVVAFTETPASPTSATDAHFAFEADEPAEYACSVDGSTSSPCTSPMDLSDLTEGAHQLQLTATDAAGNEAALQHDWTVDLTVPSLEIVSGPPAFNALSEVTIQFSASNGVTVQCALGNDELGPCTTADSVTFTDLTDDRLYTARIRATDSAGNFSEATREWVRDTVAPEVTFATTPDEYTNVTAFEFVFDAGEEATFTCRLAPLFDAQPCSSPTSYADLADAEYTLEVVATDRAGNQGANSLSFTVDTVEPTVAITAYPRQLTNSTSAQFEFTFADDAPVSAMCGFDESRPSRCEESIAFNNLADGRHDFTVEATDAAGNTGTAGYRWTVDTEPPELRFTSRLPSNPSGSSTATFEFTATGHNGTFECALDRGAYDECSSPHTLSRLGSGTTSFRVRTYDRAGNVATIGHTWTIVLRN